MNNYMKPFPGTMGKVYISNPNGCHPNSIDTARIKNFMIRNGWNETETFQEADIIIINTCAFVHSRIEDNLSLIDQIVDKKDPGAELIICGCMPVIAREKLKNIKNATLLTPHNLYELENIIGSKNAFTLQPTAQRLLLNDEIDDDRDIFMVRTNYGCLHNCSFCAVKKVFPKLKSKPPAAILRELADAVRKGCKDIGLTAEDLTAYGLDIQTNLIELLKGIVTIKGDYKLSLYRLYPQYLLSNCDAFLSLFRSNRFSYLSIPVNSGSKKILRLMGREYDAEQMKKFLLRIRQENPSIRIRGDFMVGHPGETDEDFRQTFRFVTTSNLNILFVYPFSAMTGTRSADMEDQVSQEDILYRYNMLNEAWRLSTLFQ